MHHYFSIPSEIILTFWFVAQEKNIIINVENTFNIFVETVILLYNIWWTESKKQT